MQRCHDLEFVVNCGKGSFDLHRLYGVKNVCINKKTQTSQQLLAMSRKVVKQLSIHLEETARGSKW